MQPVIPRAETVTKVAPVEVRMASESMLHDKITPPFLVRMWEKIKESFLLSAGNSSGISMNDFVRICKSQLDNPSLDDERLLRKLYQRVDRKGKGLVRTADIATTMILLCAKATPLQKLQLLFRIFGADDDSCLTHDEIFDLYLTVKTNDLTRDPKEALANMTFADELCLQESKRFYEMTVGTMQIGRDPSDFVILDEFLKVFEERPYLLENFFPGSFSLEWVLDNVPDPQEVPVTQHKDEVSANFVRALRKGEEHLNLSQRRGRGRRIIFGSEMEPLQAETPHQPRQNHTFKPTAKRKVVSDLKDKASPQQKKGRLPKLESTKLKEQARAEDSWRHDLMSSSDSSSDEAPQRQMMTKKLEKKTAYAAEEVEMPNIPWLSLQHKDGALFRALDHQGTQTDKPWRNRVKNRKLQYNCLVCGIQHVSYQGRGAKHCHE